MARRVYIKDIKCDQPGFIQKGGLFSFADSIMVGRNINGIRRVAFYEYDKLWQAKWKDEEADISVRCETDKEHLIFPEEVIKNFEYQMEQHFLDKDIKVRTECYGDTQSRYNIDFYFYKEDDDA